MDKEKSCGAVIFTRDKEEIKFVIIKDLEGNYGFPKGHVEDHETELQTALREVKEEVGLDVDIIEGFKTFDVYLTGKNKEIVKTVIYFLAIASGTGVEGAIALAVPLGLLGAALFQLCMTFNSFFPHLGDKAAAEGDRKGIVRAQLLAQIPTFVIYVTIYTIANYYGVELVQKLIAILPAQVTKALSIMAKILPAVGFAMLLKYIITPGKEWMLAFFVMGFVLIKNTSFNIVSLTLFGIGMAVMFVMARYGGELGGKATAVEGGDDYDE